ncbi:MAG: PQQ-dependent sugar dehydrogenase [Alphaproteobacteria bacterium]|nr:PQQ-dependent sugar dehydrogenase [Alphaproteobacteria bacterium]
MRALRTAVLPALALLGCSAGDSAPTAAAASADGSQPRTSLGDAPFAVEPLASFDNPWAIAFLPDGGALVTEKGGRLKFWRAGQPAADVAGLPPVAARGQGGLLDVAASPRFAADRLIYLTYAEPQANGSGLALARARLAADGGGLRLDGLEVLWRDPQGGRGGQFGAVIAFAPDGRTLFLSSGERQRFTPAQDPSQPLGKILHLTLDGKPAPGNPWAGKTGAATVTVTDPPENTEVAKTAPGRVVALPGPNLTPAETWSTGHRNPYGLAFAPDGRLWAEEMGPRGGDELNLIEPGKNYGWPLVSQGDNYDGTPIPRHPTRPDLRPPVLWWNPAISPGGMTFYTGKLFPQWKGNAFIAALSGKGLIRIVVAGATARKAEMWDFGARLRDVAEGPDGALYVLEDGERGSGGRLLRLVPKR